MFKKVQGSRSRPVVAAQPSREGMYNIVKMRSSTFASMPSKSRTLGICFFRRRMAASISTRVPYYLASSTSFSVFWWQVSGHNPDVTPTQVAEVQANHGPIRASRVESNTVGEAFMHNDRVAPSSFPITIELFVHVSRRHHQPRFL